MSGAAFGTGLSTAGQSNNVRDFKHVIDLSSSDRNFLNCLELQTPIKDIHLEHNGLQKNSLTNFLTLVPNLLSILYHGYSSRMSSSRDSGRGRGRTWQVNRVLSN